MFHVTSACYELGLRAAAILHRNVIVGPTTGEFRTEVQRAAAQIQERFQGRAEIRQLPEVAQLYGILRQVGVRPRRHPPSNQKLLEYGLKHGTLPAINNLVDAYNLVSVLTHCSLGAHDAATFSLPVELRILSGEESFRPLGSPLPQAVVAGEFGYVDSDQQLLCRLDSLQADFSKVTESSRDVLVIVEATTATPEEAHRAAVELTRETIQAECGGTAEVTWGSI